MHEMGWWRQLMTRESRRRRWRRVLLPSVFCATLTGLVEGRGAKEACLSRRAASSAQGMTTDTRNDLTRTTLAVLFIGGLIAASFWVLRPFLPAVVWATMVVVATWPLMLRAQSYLWNKRALAVTVMTLALLLVFVVPLSLAISTIVRNANRFVDATRRLATLSVPPPPEWVIDLPMIGRTVAEFWQQVAATGVHDLAARLAQLVERVPDLSLIHI